jgi:hypothetical protein
MLVYLLHAPRGPFYSSKAARSCWRQSGKTILAICRVVHRTVRCATRQELFSVRCRLLSKIGATDRWRFGAVGAPDTVRCTPDGPVPPSDRWLGHASRADCAADRWRGRPLAHRTVRWILAVRRRRIPESGQLTRRQPGAPDTVRCTTGQSGAPRLRRVLAVPAKSFSFCISLILALR